MRGSNILKELPVGFVKPLCWAQHCGVLIIPDIPGLVTVVLVSLSRVRLVAYLNCGYDSGVAPGMPNNSLNLSKIFMLEGTLMSILL